MPRAAPFVVANFACSFCRRLQKLARSVAPPLPTNLCFANLRGGPDILHTSYLVFALRAGGTEVPRYPRVRLTDGFHVASANESPHTGRRTIREATPSVATRQLPRRGKLPQSLRDSSLREENSLSRSATAPSEREPLKPPSLREVARFGAAEGVLRFLSSVNALFTKKRRLPRLGGNKKGKGQGF